MGASMAALYACVGMMKDSQWRQGCITAVAAVESATGIAALRLSVRAQPHMCAEALVGWVARLAVTHAGP